MKGLGVNPFQWLYRLWWHWRYGPFGRLRQPGPLERGPLVLELRAAFEAADTDEFVVSATNFASCLSPATRARPDFDPEVCWRKVLAKARPVASIEPDEPWIIMGTGVAVERTAHDTLIFRRMMPPQRQDRQDRLCAENPGLRERLEEARRYGEAARRLRALEDQLAQPLSDETRAAVKHIAPDDAGFSGARPKE